MRSASWSAGRPLHRRHHAIGGERVDGKAVIGQRRAGGLERVERRIHRDDQPLERAGGQMLVEPVADFRRDEDRPDALQGFRRHARRGDARGQTQVAARIIAGAGHRDAEIVIAEVAAVDGDALLERIELPAQRDAIEDQRIARIGWRAQHHRAAIDAERPRSGRLRRRLDLAHERDAIAAGQNLERHREHAASRRPN